LGTYFKLTLDTTSPQITVSAPSWVLANDILVVTVESDEPILRPQAALIDSRGNEHNIVLNNVLGGDTYWVGTLDVGVCFVGTATIRVVAQDDVFNTAVVSRGVDILSAAWLGVEIVSMAARGTSIESALRKTSIEPTLRKTSIEPTLRDLPVVLVKGRAKVEVVSLESSNPN
jgi:hypothetical protein